MDAAHSRFPLELVAVRTAKMRFPKNIFSEGETWKSAEYTMPSTLNNVWLLYQGLNRVGLYPLRFF